MNIPTILKVLKNERECIKRQSEYATPKSFVPKCDRDCANCDLCLPDNEILEVYDFLINGYELLHNEAVESYMIKCTEPLSEDQIARFKEEWSNASFSVSFEPMPLSDNFKAVILGESVDEYGREHFKGICPYTNKKCDTWTCGACEVERRERKFAEGDTE